MGIEKASLTKLLELESEKYIKEAYRSVLSREADVDGLKGYLRALNNGMSRERILFELRVSDEGILEAVNFLGFNIHQIEITRLLQLEGNSFIEAAYLAILGRTVDESGRNCYLEGLNSGALSKLDVLHELRCSEEGQALGVKVEGLAMAYRRQGIKRFVLKIPIAGRVAGFIWNLIHINRIVNMRFNSAEQHISNVERRLENTVQQMENAVHRMGIAERSIEETVHRVERTEQFSVNIKHNLDSLEQSVYNLQYQTDKLNVKIIERQKARELTVGIEYKKYEDEMRGSRDEILERLDIYEAVIKRVKSNNGDGIVALDLGCGRGEWLELLKKKYNITAVGIDSDESMLNECKKYGLNAACCDLVTYVKNAESYSVDIISMLQVAEHIPIDTLLNVLNDCYRVLRKGGALIIETPNPENVIVGACNFYLDPTHISKLPPALLKIFVESVGMSEIEVVRMHPYNAIDIAAIDSNDTKQNAIMQMAAFFNNYADYAVIAFKK